jgi:hypothetical protein
MVDNLPLWLWFANKKIAAPDDYDAEEAVDDHARIISAVRRTSPVRWTGAPIKGAATVV